MLLRIGYAFAQVLNATPEELRFLRDYLTFTSVAHTGASEKDSLLRPDGLFPAGLADMVTRAMRGRGTPLQRILRAGAGGFNPGTDLSHCWPHQREAVQMVLSGQHRGIIQHATGTGKSVTISTICRAVLGRVLVIVPSKQLLKEMHARLEQYGIKAGRVGAGFRDTKPRVVVCIAASLKVLTTQQLEGFAAVLVDECHGVPSVSILEPVMRMKNAWLRLGFSGTPMDRADKKSLYIVGVLGEVFHRFSPKKAEQEGIVAKCQLRMLPCEHVAHKTGGRYDRWEARAYTNNAKRNLLLARTVLGAASPRIVFVRTKEHQAVLAKLLGASCRIVNDETPTEQVQKLIADFKSGVVKTILSTPIFRQGIDIPEIQTVINGAGGKACIDVIQKVGRGSRRFQADGSTKDTFKVYDIDDRGCGRCGGNHKSCEWLERHSFERAEAYKRFGYTILPPE